MFNPNPLILGQQGIIKGPNYDPGMMAFDGSTGYYSHSQNTSGNLSTAVFRFNQSAATGGSYEQLIWFAVLPRARVLLWDTDASDGTRAGKLQVIVNNTAGSTICRMISTDTYVDGKDHTVFFSFDGDNGTAIFYVDGVDADDTGHAQRVAPTTGTLYTTPMVTEIGRHQTPGNYFSGQMGYIGYDNSYLTNPEDFHHPVNGLQEIDESDWASSPWGAQPLFWQSQGLMDDNKGSAGNMTENGTITGPA